MHFVLDGKSLQGHWSLLTSLPIFRVLGAQTKLSAQEFELRTGRLPIPHPLVDMEKPQRMCSLRIPPHAPTA